jgi:ATP-binding cassette subfamily B protein
MARLWELAFTKKLLVVFSCVFAVASVVVSFSPFIAIYYILREIVEHYADLATLDTAYLMSLGWIAVGGAVGAILLNFIALMFSHVAAFTTLYKLKLDFVRHLSALPLGFHSGTSTGRLRKIVDENIEKLEGFIAHQLPDLVGSFATPVVVLVILFVFDWRLGLASLIPILIVYFLQAAAMGQDQSKVFMDKYQSALEDMNNAAVEYVRGISVVKAFNQTIYSFRRFHDMIKEYGVFVKAYTSRFKVYMVLFMLVINAVYLFLLPAIILLAGGAADYGQFALAAVFYLFFSLALTGPFTKLMYVAALGTQISDGITRMDTILDIPPLPETASPKTADDYAVAFEDVVFSYNGEDEETALCGVSFTAQQGAVTALVGPSGGGKSTLAHLIPRFYDVAEGAVRIGGVDIRDMSTEYLLSIVSFVFQDVFLFRQSVLDNILIGNKDASRADVVSAAKAAQCHEFIERLPQGYDTVIGADGVHLSGGERQRIVIARAILKEAPIIVLDEATAFADPENEQRIQRAFEELMRDKTVIIIAHRLSTVRGVDKIVVIEGGKAVEEGRHDELVASGGRYSRMWEEYTGAMMWSLIDGRKAKEAKDAKDAEEAKEASHV